MRDRANRSMQPAPQPSPLLARDRERRSLPMTPPRVARRGAGGEAPSAARALGGAA